MTGVSIVTDTTACIPPEQVSLYGIQEVPVQLIFDDRTYRDGVNITPAQFYAMLRQAKRLPTTSATSPELYLEAYAKAAEKSSDILCLTEPSHFSAMYESAKVATELARDSLPGVNIEVVECTTAAAGQGLVALAAARSAAKGRPLREIVGLARDIMEQVHLFAALDTLEYLARSGRVPQAAHLVNSLLSIKPVFTLDHGDAHTVALPRTMKSAEARLVKLMEPTAGKSQPLRVAVMHADAQEQAMELGDRISARFRCREIFITEFTPVMGAHTGPGLIGVAFYGENS